MDTQSRVMVCSNFLYIEMPFLIFQINETAWQRYLGFTVFYG